MRTGWLAGATLLAAVWSAGSAPAQTAPAPAPPALEASGAGASPAPADGAKPAPPRAPAGEPAAPDAPKAAPGDRSGVTTAAAVGAQGPVVSADRKAAPEAASPASAEGGVVQAGCSTCGGGLLSPPIPGTIGGGGGCGDGCDGNCVPGRKGCDCCCNAETCVGRFICGLYECICCPDPCYDPPKWLAVADSAFYVDAARPVTQMRLRWDSNFNVKDADRAEYLFAKFNTGATANSGLQQIPSCRTGHPGKGLPCVPKKLDYEELSFYDEGATGIAGVFVEVPYREVSFDLAVVDDTDKSRNCCSSQSGFMDLNLGFKTLLLDCELIQITSQFKTFIPTGSPRQGFGVGHVSLEPALLFAVKLTPATYLQAETAYWIPIQGDPVFQANVWHSHFSLNHILWCPCHDFQLIGTAELNEWSIFGGAYTVSDYGSFGGPPDPTTGKNPNPVNIFANSGTTSMVSVGPGIRAVICEKIDFGVGSAFAVTGTRWAKEAVRAEFRWRF
jgi:hypothetical protein